MVGYVMSYNSATTACTIANALLAHPNGIRACVIGASIFNAAAFRIWTMN